MMDRLAAKIRSSLITLADPEIRRLKRKGLTYLSADKLRAIRKTIRHLETEKIPGIFVEAGCALGGSAILIALAKRRERVLFVYDVFDMIPPPSEKDGEDVLGRYEIIRSGKSAGIRNAVYYGYETNLLDKVTANFRNFGIDVEHGGVFLIPGLYEDTLKIDDKVAFAHVDCDWYDSVKTCLVQLAPNLSLGGKLIIDDYFSWSGAMRATDDYFANRTREFRLYRLGNHLHVDRISD